MEFNFNSYDTSRQLISYCEVDKCKAVIRYKQAIEKIKDFVENEMIPNGDTHIILQICNEVIK